MVKSREGTRALTRRAAAPGASLVELAERAEGYGLHARAPRTVEAYRADWSDFTGWCQANQLSSLPAAPETVALYATYLVDGRALKVSTVQRRLAAIGWAHRLSELESPTAHPRVEVTVAGIRRTHGAAAASKEPVQVDELRSMVKHLPKSLLGVRDRALLLVGFAGAFRRSELVALDVGDLRLTADGYAVTVRRSKTDQEGTGRQVGIPYGRREATCPVRALSTWLAAAEIGDGAVFRAVDRHGNVANTRLTAQAVRLVVRRAADTAGLDADLYAGHSLRSGLATAAAEAGVPERVIMATTGHKSLPMVRRYIRAGSLFRENAAASVGL